MLNKCHFQVVDNGSGVKNIVDLCERPPGNKRKVSRSLYATQRGSLYSIIKLCGEVCVTSRRFNSTLTKLFLACRQSEVVEEKRNRHSKGTTVTVEKLFSNMPVRAASVSYMDLEQAKDILVKIAVANPKITIVLKDVQSGTKLFQTHSAPTSSDNFLLYCHYAIDWQRLSQVKFQLNGYKLEGYLNVDLHHKPRQLVYVNRRCIEDDRIRRFANDILISALGPLDKRNQENRFPVFLILITCKPIKVDICFESNKFLEFDDWDSVFTLVYRCIVSFFEAEDIQLNVTEAEASRLISPCPSLRSILRETSPAITIKSNRAQRASKAQADISPEGKSLTESQSPDVRNELLIKSSEVQHKMLSKPHEVRYKIRPDPELLNVVKQTFIETPKKTSQSIIVPKKRVLADLDFSPHKNSKSANCESRGWILKTPEKQTNELSEQLKTPPFRVNNDRLMELQNAPVLNHLFEAEAKLREEEPKLPTSAKTVARTSTISRNTPSNQINDTSFDILISKRRSSTPLCPSKSGSLILDISPIKLNKPYKQFLSPFVQTKRKRSHRSSSVSKKKAIKEYGYTPRENEETTNSYQHRFHLETPQSISGKNAMEPSSEKRSKEPKRDSGYQTVSRQNSNPLSMIQCSVSHLFSCTTPDNDIFVPEMKSESDSTKSVKKSKEPFEVFEDEELTVPNKIEADELLQSPPHRFKVYWDEPEHENSFNNNIKPQPGMHDLCIHRTPKSRQVLQDKPDVKPQLKMRQNSVPKSVVGHKIVETSDCACSPIKIPVDRGCSPVNFTQMDIRNCNKSKVDVLVEEECSSQIEQSPLAVGDSFTDAFSEVDDSILAGVDRKIDEITKEMSAKATDSDPSEYDNVISSPCLECHTQSVAKRLDFNSQVPSKIISVDVVDKENIRPEYQVTAPVSAATHLVADCERWNHAAPKLSIIRKSDHLDLRKWKNNVFVTHGEGAWNIQKNQRQHMKFLLDATKFDKSVFDGLSVLGQIDDKFIGCVSSSEMLILVDQHAAHERVRLECMLDAVYKDGDPCKGVKTKIVSTPIPIKVIKSDAEFIMNISSKLEHAGFEIDASKFQHNILAIPAFCFTDSGIMNIPVDDIVTAFHQMVDQIRDSKGSNLALPVKLVNYLHSRACHGAIRFGDELTLEQCQMIIDQLSHCDLPFQCAHGRPSFAPIIKIKENAPVQAANNVEPICSELSFLKLRSRFRPC